MAEQKAFRQGNFPRVIRGFKYLLPQFREIFSMVGICRYDGHFFPEQVLRPSEKFKKFPRQEMYTQRPAQLVEIHRITPGMHRDDKGIR